MRRKLRSVALCLLVLGGLVGTPVFANDDPTLEAGELQREDQIFVNVDENGNVTEMDTAAMENELAQTPMMMADDDESRAVNIGVVNFRTKGSAAYNTLYTEDGTNKAGYLNGYAAGDAAFLGYSPDGSKVKFKMSGVVGWVNANEVQVIDYGNVKSVSYYKVVGGNLYHYISGGVYSGNYLSSIYSGKNPGYLKENTPYYSYDGHYFYTSYDGMINDYKSNTYKSSVNPNNPYYNYFQYLPHRSKTNLNASQLDQKINSITDGQGKMVGLGSTFIDCQNKYGTNATLVFGVAALESAWGRSNIALSKNNLFGHGAVDSNPYWGANGYASPEESVIFHSKHFMSIDYCDPLDYSGRYFGSHLGDKASGVNVKYASDPYWGEKVASVVWNLNDMHGNKDVSKYTIAIKSKGDNINVRKEATTASNSLYMTTASDTYPVIVLGEVKGQSVSGNTTWYKIQSDPTLDAARSKITQDVGDYDFNKYYGYISSAYVTKVNQGDTTPTPPPTGDILMGDVNLDGKITPSDYVMVKNHIMGTSKLSGNKLSAADMNGDGNISPADYVLIKNTIMGK